MCVCVATKEGIKLHINFPPTCCCYFLTRQQGQGEGEEEAEEGEGEEEKHATKMRSGCELCVGSSRKRIISHSPKCLCVCDCV